MAGKALTGRAKLAWVPLDQMRVREEVSQRRFDQNWANKIANAFDPKSFSPPTVNKVGDWYWIIDGQHSTWAYKQWLGAWHGQKVECWVYEGLDEKGEADLFDHLNTTKRVSAYDIFLVRLTAEREEETHIASIVRERALKIARQRGNGAITCVSALTKVYRRGADTLARDLEIVHSAFGDSGLDSDIIDGVGLLVSRYNGKLDDAEAIRALSTLRGGVNTLRSRAAHLRKQTGVRRSHCIAAAVVETINRAKGGRKLPSWWKSEVER